MILLWQDWKIVIYLKQFLVLFFHLASALPLCLLTELFAYIDIAIKESEPYETFSYETL